MTYTGTLAAAAVKVAASLGVHATHPVRPDTAAWLQRELDVVR